MKKPIYLDYSATTPVDPRVAAKMIPYLTEHFGNPASRSHAFGWETEKAVEEAREEVAKLVNCDPKELVWTSGATESINLALKGAARFYKDKGKHLVTVKTEHKATLDTMRELERDGFEVTYLDVKPDGLLDLDAFEAALFFVALEDTVGADHLTSALRRMFRAREGVEVSPADLRSAMEAASGRDLAAMFHDWLDRLVVPDDFRTRYAGRG